MFAEASSKLKGVLQVDVTREHQVQQLFAGPGKDVDILVNSAGTMWTKSFASLRLAGALQLPLFFPGC